MSSWSISQVLGIGVGVLLVFALFRYRNQIQKFVIEVGIELKKVSWPTRKELVDSTIIVFLSSLAFTVLIGGFDFVLSKLLSLMITK